MSQQDRNQDREIRLLPSAAVATGFTSFFFSGLGFELAPAPKKEL